MFNRTQEDQALFIFILCIVITMLLCYFVSLLKSLLEERRYLKIEMNRSYEVQEFQYWKRKLRLVYIAHIPFFGKALVKLFR